MHTNSFFLHLCVRCINFEFCQIPKLKIKSIHLLLPPSRLCTLWSDSQRIHRRVCRLCWHFHSLCFLQWETLVQHVLRAITTSRLEGRPAACIYSQSYVTWSNTTLENVTHGLRRNDCQPARLIYRNTQPVQTLPLLPRWLRETPVNFGNTSRARSSAAGKAIPRPKTILRRERIGRLQRRKRPWSAARLAARTSESFSRFAALGNQRGEERRHCETCWKLKIWTYFFSFHRADCRQIVPTEATGKYCWYAKQEETPPLLLLHVLSVLTLLTSPASDKWQIRHVYLILNTHRLLLLTTIKEECPFIFSLLLENLPAPSFWSVTRWNGALILTYASILKAAWWWPRMRPPWACIHLLSPMQQALQTHSPPLYNTKKNNPLDSFGRSLKIKNVPFKPPSFTVISCSPGNGWDLRELWKDARAARPDDQTNKLKY